MTAPVWGSGAGAWPSGAAININGSYVTVDGGTNGYIKATLSGAVGTSCSGGSCVYDQTTAGTLVAASANNVEVKNLTITDIYRCNNASACNTNWYTAGIMMGFPPTTTTYQSMTTRSAKWVRRSCSSMEEQSLTLTSTTTRWERTAMVVIGDCCRNGIVSHPRLERQHLWQRDQSYGLDESVRSLKWQRLPL